MAKSLHQVLTQSLSQKNKSVIGYTVKTYQGVLSDLEVAEGGSSSDSGNQVFGITRTDYSGVTSMNFDANTGMSQNSDAIWKMKLTTTGSCPVKYNEAYDIVKFPHEGLTNTQRNPFTTVTEMCPYILDSEKLKQITANDFKVGAAVDLSNLAVTYFNKYYTNSNVKTIDANMITKLLAAGCLRAQIIFPNKNKSLLVDVIQHTPFSNMACIYISTPIASAAEWNECDIVVKIKAQGKVQDFIPNGATYVSAVGGQSYYVGKGTMGGMSKSNYQKWLNRSAATYVTPAKHILQLVKGELKDCYVKLFVPLQKKGEAMKILPDRVNETIFTEYKGVQITEGGTTNNTAQGTLGVILQGLCREWYGVRVNDGDGTVIYSYNSGNTCRTLSRGAGGTFYSSTVGQIKPNFGSTKDNLYLDCSAFASFILLNCSAIRDDVQTVTTYSTGNMAQFPDYLNTILKPGYKAVLLENTDHKQIRTGDLMYCDSREKGQYKGKFQRAGHAAVAYVKDGRVHTLEIGTKDPGQIGKLKDRNEIPKNGKYFYRHIVRIIKE